MNILLSDLAKDFCRLSTSVNYRVIEKLHIFICHLLC